MSAPTTPVRQITVVCNGGCIGSVSDKPEGDGAVCAVRRVWGEDVPLEGYGSKGVLLSRAKARNGVVLLGARSPDERRRWWGMDGRACKATPVVGC